MRRLEWLAVGAIVGVALVLTLNEQGRVDALWRELEELLANVKPLIDQGDG